MGRIETLSDFGGKDYLEGAPVRAGETLRVTWPDGSQEEVIVNLQVRQGADWMDALAHADGLYRGQPCLVKLSGLEAIRLGCSCVDGSCEWCESRFKRPARPTLSTADRRRQRAEANAAAEARAIARSADPAEWQKRTRPLLAAPDDAAPKSRARSRK